MNITEAKDECQRWLDYLARMEQKSFRLKRLASDVRRGWVDAADAKREMVEMDERARLDATVYDGARLADAVRALMAAIDTNERLRHGQED